jgi:hypothetical protein
MSENRGENYISSSFAEMEDAKDVITVMFSKESTTYLRSDYLTGSQHGNIVDGTWRQRIIEWMFGVVDHCSLRRDSVAVAAYYLDLAVAKGAIETREQFQLAAMTALQLAIKLFDSTIVKMDSLIKLSRGMFKIEDVISMEAKILQNLGWQVHPPTAICFLRQYFRLLPPSVAPTTRYLITEVTRFISEISTCLYKFISYPPSALAFAGMLIAMERIDTIALPTWQRQQIFENMSALNLDRNSQMIREIVARLHVSLEKNVSLQELMETICARCQASGLSTYAAADNCKVVQIRLAGYQSPREVVTPQPRHTCITYQG